MDMGVWCEHNRGGLWGSPGFTAQFSDHPGHLSYKQVPPCPSPTRGSEPAGPWGIGWPLVLALLPRPTRVVTQISARGQPPLQTLLGTGQRRSLDIVGCAPIQEEPGPLPRFFGETEESTAQRPRGAARWNQPGVLDSILGCFMGVCPAQASRSRV